MLEKVYRVQVVPNYLVDDRMFIGVYVLPQCMYLGTGYLLSSQKNIYQNKNVTRCEPQFLAGLLLNLLSVYAAQEVKGHPYRDETIRSEKLSLKPKQ